MFIIIGELQKKPSNYELRTTSLDIEHNDLLDYGYCTRQNRYFLTFVNNAQIEAK